MYELKTICVDCSVESGTSISHNATRPPMMCCDIWEQDVRSTYCQLRGGASVDQTYLSITSLRGSLD